MARLPQPGADDGIWGQILNDYLSAAHNADGTLKDNSVTNNTIAANTINASALVNGTIAEAKLDTSVQTKLNAAVDATTTAKGIVQLAGDLGGTAASPTVPGLAAKANQATTYTKTEVDTSLSGKANTTHTHTASQISDSTVTGRAVLTAADAATARSAIGVTNTVQIVTDFSSVTTPVYGTLYVVRA